MEIARYWRLNSQRYNLTGRLCTCCGKPSFSQRPMCEACGGSAYDGHPDRKQAARHEAMPAGEPAGK